MSKKILKAEVLENIEIAPGVMKMTMRSEELSASMPGQFMNVYPDPDRLILPRPFGIHYADPAEGTVSIIYEIVGEGTEDLSLKKAGDVLRAAGPLGNGFDLGVFGQEGAKTAMLTGGGVGTSVLLLAAAKLAEMNVTTAAVLGFREYPYEVEAFEALGCKVYTATDVKTEGSFHGNVCECIDANALSADVCFACGPAPMLRALTAAAETEERAADLQISMDGRMGCGYGVCLGCSISLKKPEGTVRKRVCADGPVFRGNEVIW